MTATFFEQRASYFFANNKKDKLFTVNAIGLVVCDDRDCALGLREHDSDSSFPTSTPLPFFSLSSSSSSADEDELASESGVSIDSTASSSEEPFQNEMYHIDKPIKDTS